MTSKMTAPMPITIIIWFDSAGSSSVYTDPSSFVSTVTPETSVSSVYVNSVVTDELVSSEPELPPDSASDLAPVHEKLEPCLAFC